MLPCLLRRQENRISFDLQEYWEKRKNKKGRFYFYLLRTSIKQNYSPNYWYPVTLVLGWFSSLYFLSNQMEVHNEKITGVVKRITKPGASLSLELTSTTSPEIGELTSLVAFTLSTAPKPFPFETEPPGSGSSTNTTSPRWSYNNFHTYTNKKDQSKIIHQVFVI